MVLKCRKQYFECNQCSHFLHLKLHKKLPQKCNFRCEKRKYVPNSNKKNPNYCFSIFIPINLFFLITTYLLFLLFYTIIAFLLFWKIKLNVKKGQTDLTAFLNPLHEKTFSEQQVKMCLDFLWFLMQSIYCRKFQINTEKPISELKGLAFLGANYERKG